MPKVILGIIFLWFTCHHKGDTFWYKVWGTQTRTTLFKVKEDTFEWLIDSSSMMHSSEYKLVISIPTIWPIPAHVELPQSTALNLILPAPPQKKTLKTYLQLKIWLQSLD